MRTTLVTPMAHQSCAVRVADGIATWLVRLVGLLASGALGAVTFDRFMSRTVADWWRVAACAGLCVSLLCMVAWFERIAKHTPLPARPRLLAWILALVVAIAVVGAWLSGFRAGLTLVWWRDTL